jgi:RHS repeat-associated protein
VKIALFLGVSAGCSCRPLRGQIAPYTLRTSGQYYDAESGLNYNINRNFDSTLGRYVQSDPFGLVAGMSTYNYVLGNPLLSSDPLGLMNLVFQVSLTGVIGNWGGSGAVGVYVTLPWIGQLPDAGVLASGGPAIAGADGGLAEQGGLVIGNESDIKGLSENVELDAPPVGGTAVFDDQSNLSGLMIGPAEEIGASANVQQTYAFGLNDLGSWLGGEIYDLTHPYNPNGSNGTSQNCQ